MTRKYFNLKTETTAATKKTKTPGIHDRLVNYISKKSANETTKWHAMKVKFESWGFMFSTDEAFASFVVDFLAGMTGCALSIASAATTLGYFWGRSDEVKWWNRSTPTFNFDENPENFESSRLIPPKGNVTLKEAVEHYWKQNAFLADIRFIPVEKADLYPATASQKTQHLK